MERTMEMYGGKVHGVAVSHYGLECGYLDYRALAALVGDMILNNTLMSATYPEDWELISGEDCYGLDSDGHHCSVDDEYCEEIEYYTVYQTYIISERGYEFLSEYTDEIVYYNNALDVYLWGVCHYGISWDYVLADIKLKEML